MSQEYSTARKVKNHALMNTRDPVNPTCSGREKLVLGRFVEITSLTSGCCSWPNTTLLVFPVNVINPLSSAHGSTPKLIAGGCKNYKPRSILTSDNALTVPHSARNSSKESAGNSPLARTKISQWSKTAGVAHDVRHFPHTQVFPPVGHNKPQCSQHTLACIERVGVSLAGPLC